MTKKINATAIVNELEGTAFFPSNKKLTQPSNNPQQEHSTKSQKTKIKSSKNDVMTSSRQDANLRKWRDVIEDTETHNSALRMTKEERYDVEDLVSELRRKFKIKTSMNEVARLGLLYIINDFKKDKTKALIIKVKKS